MKTRKAETASLPMEPGSIPEEQVQAQLEDEGSEKPGTVTKRKLVVEITREIEQEAGEGNKRALTQLEVFSVIQRTLDHISRAMAGGQKVELRNFGVFEVKVRKARVGRNPNAPEVDVPIPERAVVKFKAGKDMREAVLKLTPQQSEG